MRQPSTSLLLAPILLLGGCTLGPTELGIILAIVVLLFGASRLPALGRAMGETLRSFKKATTEDDEEAKGKELGDDKGVKQLEKARVEPDEEDKSG